MGGTVGDENARVRENRRRTLLLLGDLVSIFHVWQVHSADVICVDAPTIPVRTDQSGCHPPTDLR
jgi:copper oxidase (laccase) domain-containing protein